MDYHINLTMFKQEIVDTDLTFCQGDYGNRLIISGISDSRNPRIVFKKADGNTVERKNLMRNIDGDYVYTLKATELQHVGKVIADVKFTDANSRESSQKFSFTVKADTITDSVKNSEAYSDSIKAAQVEFDALIQDMITQIANNTAQKIAEANTQLQTYCDNLFADANAAIQACKDIVANKIGISNTPGDATAFSGNYTQSLVDGLDQNIQNNATKIQEVVDYFYPKQWNDIEIVNGWSGDVFFRKHIKNIELHIVNVFNTNSTWDKVGVLPEGYRPDKQVNALIKEVESKTVGEVIIYPNGDVFVLSIEDACKANVKYTGYVLFNTNDV